MIKGHISDSTFFQFVFLLHIEQCTHLTAVLTDIYELYLQSFMTLLNIFIIFQHTVLRVELPSLYFSPSRFTNNNKTATTPRKTITQKNMPKSSDIVLLQNQTRQMVNKEANNGYNGKLQSVLGRLEFGARLCDVQVTQYF